MLLELYQSLLALSDLAQNLAGTDVTVQLTVNSGDRSRVGGCQVFASARAAPRNWQLQFARGDANLAIRRCY